jgi:hypothetical protein
MQTPRPITQLLSKETTPTSGKWVAKRDRSAHGDHVQKVDFDQMTDDDPLQHVWQDINHQWIIQGYVPLLEQWGEWRVFLINGKVRYVTMTTLENNEWTWNKADSMFTLEKLM